MTGKPTMPPHVAAYAKATGREVTLWRFYQDYESGDMSALQSVAEGLEGFDASTNRGHYTREAYQTFLQNQWDNSEELWSHHPHSEKVMWYMGEPVPDLHDPRWLADVLAGLRRQNISVVINHEEVSVYAPPELFSKTGTGWLHDTGPDIETALCEAVNRMEEA